MCKKKVEFDGTDQQFGKRLLDLVVELHGPAMATDRDGKRTGGTQAVEQGDRLSRVVQFLSAD
jgi:hypothetical protein